MEILVWLGAAVSFVGLIGLVTCIAIAWRAKRAGLDDDSLRAKLQSVVALNMGALFLSVIGLMLVLIGVLLA